MNIKTTALLALPVFGLWGYIAYYEKPQQRIEAQSKFVFPGLTRGEIEQIEVSFVNTRYTLKNKDPKKSRDEQVPVDEFDGEGQQLVGQRDAKQWELVGTPQAKLEDSKLEAILSSIIQLKSEDTVPAAEVEKDLALYGLKTPPLEVSVTYGGQTKKLLIGNRNEYVAKRYAQLAGSGDLLMLTQGLFEAALKNPSDLRDGTPIELDDADIGTIAIESSGKLILSEKKDYQRWEIQKPVIGTGSVDAYDTLIKNLRNIKVDDYIDDVSDLKKYGLEPSFINLTIKKGDKELVLQFGKAQNRIWLRIGGEQTIYRLKDDPTPQIPLTVDNYRERKLIQFDDELVQQISVIEGEQKIEAKKEEDGWKVGESLGDATFISQYLKDLKEINALSFKDNAQLVPSTMLLEIVVKVKDGDEGTEKRFFVLAKEKGGYLVSYGEGKEQFYISEDAFNKMKPKREGWLKVKS